MLDEKFLDVLFRKARTHNVFSDQPVSDEILRQVHELMKWGPTSANCQPARLVFVRSKAAKEQLAPALSPTNLDKTMKAPLTAIVVCSEPGTASVSHLLSTPSHHTKSRPR